MRHKTGKCELPWGDQPHGSFLRRYDALASKYDALKSEHDQLEAEIADKVSRRESMNQFIATLHRQSGLAQDFEENLWGSLVEVVTVYSGMNVRFTFRDGTIITA